MSRKRKFSDDYVQYRFTFITEKDGTQKPQCFLCSKLLCNENMKPSKLKEHFKALHPTNLDSIETLKQKRARFDSTAKLPQLGFKPVSDKPLLLASYQVAYRIAKNKKPTPSEKIWSSLVPLRWLKLFLERSRRFRSNKFPYQTT